MWQLLTGLVPDSPPQSSLCEFIRVDGRHQQFWTYGGLVEKQPGETNYHDPQLAQVVAWCMGEHIHLSYLGIYQIFDS